MMARQQRNGMDMAAGGTLTKIRLYLAFLQNAVPVNINALKQDPLARMRVLVAFGHLV
jgi:hypothetical protein